MKHCVFIESIQFDGKNLKDCRKWVLDRGGIAGQDSEGKVFDVYTQLGGISCDPGDWITYAGEGLFGVVRNVDFNKFAKPLEPLEALYVETEKRRNEFFPGTEYWNDFEAIRSKLAAFLGKGEKDASNTGAVGENEGTGGEGDRGS